MSQDQNDSFSKLVQDIPEDLQTQEAIQSAKDMLAGRSKDDPETAIATAAISFCTHGMRGALREIQNMNVELDGNWPHGDMILYAALYAAAGAMNIIFLEKMPKAELVGALDIGDLVVADVAAMVKQSLDPNFKIGVSKTAPHCFSLKIKRDPKP